MSSRCTGHCCRRFYLPLSPTQIKGEAALVRLGGRSRFNPTEIAKIADMVILVDQTPKPNNDSEYNRYHDDSVGYFYTCKHHNKDTGDCMNYENRPNLCRDYPYGGSCAFKGCTYIPDVIPGKDLTKQLNADKVSE